ncbi:hypothetical protein J5839_01600, partial [Methanosarcinaceae archaeon]|nr:hypothetical protein [Methanosarcinaceae archaeon]
PEEEQNTFKATLMRFNRVYSFITQVCRLFDKDIHKFSAYSKYLITDLPKGRNFKNLDDAIDLEYYRLRKNFEGSISLESVSAGFAPISGNAGRSERQKNFLAEIIEEINQKYGTEFTEMDKVLLQIENDYAKDEKLKNYAVDNDFRMFIDLFDNMFYGIAAERYKQNDNFFKILLSDPEIMEKIKKGLGQSLYDRLKRQYEESKKQSSGFMYQESSQVPESVSEEKEVYDSSADRDSSSSEDPVNDDNDSDDNSR